MMQLLVYGIGSVGTAYRTLMKNKWANRCRCFVVLFSFNNLVCIVQLDSDGNSYFQTEVIRKENVKTVFDNDVLFAFRLAVDFILSKDGFVV